jgi:hypothetical protein
VDSFCAVQALPASVRTAALRRRKMADRSLGRDIGSSHHSSRSLEPASHEVNRTGRTTVSLLLELLGVVRTGDRPTAVGSHA